MATFTLPHSGVKITLTDRFSPSQLSKFLDLALDDRIDVKAAQSKPIETLEQLGIQVDAADIEKLRAEGIGQMVRSQSQAGESPTAAAAVVVGVVVFCWPSQGA